MRWQHERGPDPDQPELLQDGQRVIADWLLAAAARDPMATARMDTAIVVFIQ